MTDAATLDETGEKVVGIIAEQAVLQPGDVQMDATPDDLGLDSLAIVEIVFAIEEEFDISVPFNANEAENPDFDISTVRSTIAAVSKLIAEQKG